MHAEIVVLPGDGIGPEVAAAAVAVLKSVATRFNHTFTFSEHDIGGIAIDRHGEPLPASTLAACQAASEKAIVIVHGTDTMRETAEVLGTVATDKTIVFTGAMIPYELSLIHI